MAGRPKNRNKEDSEGYSTSEVCRLLQISKRTLQRRAEDEDWPRVRDEQGNWTYDKAAIDNLVGVPQYDKGDLLEIFSATIESQNKHIHDLIKLVHGPAANFIESQKDELERTRKRLREYEGIVGELHAMYGELMRTMAQQESESLKEAQSIRMRDEAFGMLKERLLPLMLDKIRDNTLIQSLTTAQIEALVTIHNEAPNNSILSNEQATFLEKELVKRKGKDNAGKQQRTEDDGNGTTKEAVRGPSE